MGVLLSRRAEVGFIQEVRVWLGASRNTQQAIRRRAAHSATVLLRYCYGIAPMGIAMPMGVIP